VKGLKAYGIDQLLVTVRMLPLPSYVMVSVCNCGAAGAALLKNNRARIVTYIVAEFNTVVLRNGKAWNSWPKGFDSH
jgi:hypothetical protein